MLRGICENKWWRLELKLMGSENWCFSPSSILQFLEIQWRNCTGRGGVCVICVAILAHMQIRATIMGTQCPMWFFYIFSCSRMQIPEIATDTSQICFNAHKTIAPNWGWQWNCDAFTWRIYLSYPASILNRCSCLLKQIWEVTIDVDFFK